jgi:signal transduction histidine kinase
VLGGQIRFDSYEGEGTSFEITFPLRLESPD